LRPFLR